MNSKRHAELQRKLTLAQVPKPPADLLDRIKNDIPEYLRPEVDRARLSRSLSFNLRVAAAFLVVISSVVGTIYLLEPEDQLAKMGVAPKPATVAQVPYPRSASAAATDEVHVEISQQQAPAAKPVMQIASSETAAPRLLEGRRDQPREEAAVARAAEEDVQGGAGGFAPSFDTEVAVAPPAPAAAPAPQQAISVTAEAPMAQTRQSKVAVGSLVSEAYAADLDLGPRGNVFGISLDPNVFQRIKDALEKNERPSASAVNVEAIINYFAGGPARKVRHGVKLEVEGSRSPVDQVAQHGFLRFTVDTAAADSTLPVAADAKLEVDLNGKVVARAEPVGDSTVSGDEPALLQNLSVTGLYELRLQPNLRPSDRVATVRLTYTDIADGQRHTLERSVYARDFGKLWTRASRRHRLASLGAVWGQSLKGTSPANEVARRAEELATQEPADTRAQELATAATASSKLNSGF